MSSFSNIRYVFLDRDGVINRKAPEGEYISQWENFHVLPGVEQAIAHLNARGYKVLVVSNQRGIALGRYRHEDVKHIHEKLQAHLQSSGAQIDAIYYCPHDKDTCNCRKPQPGLFLRAFQDFPDANPENSVIIGDSLSDIEAGKNLGMTTIFLDGPGDTQKPGAEQARKTAHSVVQSLAEAVRLLLS